MFCNDCYRKNALFLPNHVTISISLNVRDADSTFLKEVSAGGISGTIADPGVTFVAALKANCCAIIITHNYPSHYLKTSRQDVELTTKN